MSVGCAFFPFLLASPGSFVSFIWPLLSSTHLSTAFVESTVCSLLPPGFVSSSGYRALSVCVCKSNLLYLVPYCSCVSFTTSSVGCLCCIMFCRLCWRAYHMTDGFNFESGVSPLENKGPVLWFNVLAACHWHLGRKLIKCTHTQTHANTPIKNIWFKQTQHGVDDSQLFFGQPKISETVAICGTLIWGGDLFWIQNISKSDASPHAHTQPNPCSIREEIQITRVKEARWLSVCLAVHKVSSPPFPLVLPLMVL